MSVIGYKAMNKDLTCRNYSFKVGKTYKTEKIEMCSTGFHFCINFFDVYEYYPKNSDTVVCRIEALGDVKTEGNKSCTNEIKIVSQMTEKDLLDMWINKPNSGYGNSGYGNSGNRNSGDWNSGDGNSGYGNSGYGNSGDWNSGDGNSGNRNSGNRNSGNWNSGYGNSGYGNSGNRNSGDWNSGDGNSGYGNSGDRNSGDWNSGNRNSGNRNSGNWNSGDGNSGYGNSGDRNSGDWNSGDGNSGYFNTTVPVYFFNKPSNIAYTKELENKIRSLNVKPIVQWIGTSLMTEEEKNNNPSYKVTEGFLRKTDRFDWSQLSDNDKSFIKSLPNFDNEVFKVISNGVSLLEEFIEVIVKGKTKKLTKLTKQQAQELGLLD